jgi:hypothetical protein
MCEECLKEYAPDIYEEYTESLHNLREEILMIEKLKGNQTYTDDLKSGLIRDKLNELIEAVNLMMTESESRRIRAKKLAEDWEREDRYR